jgi:flagellar biosynthesis/type III secretory pathway chaperone
VAVLDDDWRSHGAEAVGVTATPGLSEILAGEAVLYERLLAVLAEEERALVRGRLGAVADCVTRKENLVLEIRLAELARQSALARTSSAADDPSEQAAVSAARERLRDVVPEVLRANRCVAALVDRSLARLHTTLEILQDTAGAGRQYRPDGGLVGQLPSAVDGRA